MGLGGSWLSGAGLGNAAMKHVRALASSGSNQILEPGVPLEYVDPAIKKQLADIALNAAKAKGASYVDVRIGRYRNQFIITREDKVLNTVDTESYGIGIRAIANGCWGFAATDRMDK